jgi:polysaccharide export outer membrane protein
MYGSSELEEFVNRTGPPVGAAPEYRVGIGDKLDVIFLYHSNLSTRDLLVRSDGRISLPYVGDQVAMGYTPMELDSILTDRFSEILKEPNLSVILNEPAEQKVYVLGNVKAPGDYPCDRPVSILQAVALAGGFSGGAKPQNTILIRRESLTKIVGIEIDVKAIMKGEAVQSDILLKNYDIVFVPQSRLNTVADFARQVSDIVNLPLKTTLDGWQIANQKASYEFWRDNRNTSN